LTKNLTTGALLNTWVSIILVRVLAMDQIILLGRGGQGAVTSSRVLAIAAFEDGKYSQAFPNFGVERMGAPVRSYCRIDKKPINLREQVYEAEYAIILDSTLLSGFIEKVSKMVIINSAKKPSEIKLNTNAEIKTVDITKIALEKIGKPFVNIAALGAFAGFTKEVSLEALEKAVQQQMGNKGPIVEKNLSAIREVYEQSK
jgi:pyruvate ferredoxin oxidoreductase gamma subunit